MTFYQISLVRQTSQFVVQQLRDGYRSVPDLSDKLKFVGQQLTEGLMPSRKPQVAVSAQRA